MIKLGVVLKAQVTAYNTNLGKRLFLSLPQTTKPHWHLEAQELVCHLELVGRGRTVVTQPGRVLLTGSQAENNVKVRTSAQKQMWSQVHASYGPSPLRNH